MTHYKENMGNNPSHTVKIEPTEFRMAPDAFTPSSTVNIKAEAIDALKTSSKNDVAQAVPRRPDATTSTGDATDPVNQENDDVPMEDVVPTTSARVAAEPSNSAYKIYDASTEIEYTPELALQHGLKMVNKLAASIEGLQLGPRRREVWLRNTASLRSQGVPSTLIAICGATGAGKSSILNAILDDNIVPTSGMRACTAVVTEIAYHKKKTIDADVSFLSEAEWKAELEILLSDMVDEDGSLKRSSDLKSDAGVAWHKVHAVYPTITQDKLVSMTPDEIIAKDPKIAKILGATKKIVAKDSKTFGIEIAKYIDSKDRGKDRKKEKGNKESKTLMEKVKEAAGQGKSKKDDANTPALWPLIRQICPESEFQARQGTPSERPTGTGDANAARSSIAKEYMKKANCIWILAPITRAVDDKIAKDLLGDAFRMQLMMDGNYDDNAITFIATKCDDISCSEIIQSLSLEDKPELQDIEEKLDTIAEEASEWKKKKAVADRLVKSLDTELKGVRAIQKEYEAHLQALEDDEPFVPRLTAPKSAKPKATKGKKRKNIRGGKKGSPKRRRSGSFDSADEDELMGSSDEERDDPDAARSSDSDFNSDSSVDSDNEEKDSDDEIEKDSDDDVQDSDQEKDSDIESVHDEMEEVTEDSLKLKITETKALVKDARQRQNDARKQRKEATDYLATLKKRATHAQKEKNAFCSLRRSAHSREVLKEDFRTGLKDLDDAEAEQRDPANFDPAVSLRDYNAIDLPVFTCSSRDYVRIKKQVKGDGEPACFSNVRDTGIPELQEWCHKLTKSSRERAAKTFVEELAAFATGVNQYVAGIGDVTAADRSSLRDKWESGEQEVDPVSEAEDDDPFAGLLGGANLYTMNTTVPKVDRFGDAVGITPRLVAEFGQIIETNVSLLKDHLRDGLEERCRVGAANAAEAAVGTSDEYASSQHWASYRASLRRNGEYRRDLNVELVNPFTRNIAQKWQQVFEADVFSPLLSATTASINKLVGDVEQSAAPGLRDRARIQGESCLNEARVALDKTVDTVKQTLNNEQKEVSRSLAPHVQGQLLDGYQSAMAEKGKGSVARQKACFHDYVSDYKDEIFDDGAEVILERLTGAADAIGKALELDMENLAQKIEVNLAVLWEGVRDDPAQVAIRSAVVTEVNQLLEQLRLFAAAEKARHEHP